MFLDVRLYTHSPFTNVTMLEEEMWSNKYCQSFEETPKVSCYTHVIYLAQSVIL
jgi:hypothetical protein